MSLSSGTSNAIASFDTINPIVETLCIVVRTEDEGGTNDECIDPSVFTGRRLSPDRWIVRVLDTRPQFSSVRLKYRFIAIGDIITIEILLIEIKFRLQFWCAGLLAIFGLFTRWLR